MEVWVPVAFAAVIVLGITVTRVWHTLLTNGLPLVGALLDRKRATGERAPVPGVSTEAIVETERRIEHLEERVCFLEALLENRDPPEQTPEFPL